MNNPIITSILDTDAYKLHMQQAIWHLYPQAKVKLEFYCRNEENLQPYITRIKQEVAQLALLSLTTDELSYLTSLDVFKSDYLTYLSQYRFNPTEVNIFFENEKLNIIIEGDWHQVMLWEIPLLAIISEVRNQFLYPEKNSSAAETELTKKIQLLNDKKFINFKLIEFGTRRRFSKYLQEYVLRTLTASLPDNLVGTSNYWLAKKYNLPPIGTQAHEWFQGHQALSHKLEDSQKMALNNWLKEYPEKLGVALTDCITMDAFLRDFNLDLAQAYTGLRQDSGDPFMWGEKAIHHYQKLDIDPLSKMLVFSDRLDITKAIDIFTYFEGRAQTSFGIGTNLTCDLTGVEAMNIVIKLTQCNRQPVAKISDSPGKTICRDTAYLSRLKYAFAVDESTV